MAIALVALMLCMTLFGCAKTLKGTYVAEGDLFGIASAGTAYTFSGNKVTVAVKAGVLVLEATQTFEGTYEIVTAEDGTMDIVFTFGDDDARKYSGTFDFEEIDGGIKIGGITHKKR
jgi:hypothetical protein